MIELNLLLGFMIVAAIVAVESHSLISSVISVGAVGLGLSIVFILLGAPELAITQLVVEILALIILIRATVASTVPETYRGREYLAYMIAALFIATFAVIAFGACQNLHQFGAVKGNSGAKVAELVLQSRVVDTLGGMAGLFAAVVGAMAVLRLKGRKEIEERDETDS